MRGILLLWLVMTILKDGLHISAVCRKLGGGGGGQIWSMEKRELQWTLGYPVHYFLVCIN